MNKDRDIDRFHVDSSVLEDARISWKAKGVYAAYCLAQQRTGKTRPTLSDILTFSGASGINSTESGLRELRSLGIIPEGTNKPQKPGYIYLIYSESTGLYKIGLSKTPRGRLKALSSSLGESLSLIWQCYVTSMGDAEDGLHDRFSAKRVTGEWFQLNDSDVEAIIGGVA